MSQAALTLAEARAILAADENLDQSFATREAEGRLLGLEGDAWRQLVAAAHERVAAFEGSRS